MIEYAFVMNQQELDNFFESIYRNYTNKKSQAWVCMLKNKDILTESYYEYQAQQVGIYYEARKAFEKEKGAWEKKVCDGCSGKMEIVNTNNGTFWGCINFKDSSFTHRIFYLNHDEKLAEKEGYLKVRIDSNWTTDIIRQNNLQSVVRASDLLEFYEYLGLEDLREKYDYGSSKGRISGYIKAKEASSTEENEITTHLSPLFSKSSKQTGIKYKLQGQSQKVAIIDLILSNKSEVNVIEIKRSLLDLKEEQLQLYHALVSFVLKEKGDDRMCKALFIVYNKDAYDREPNYKYLLYAKIQDINNGSLIQEYFNESIYL